MILRPYAVRCSFVLALTALGAFSYAGCGGGNSATSSGDDAGGDDAGGGDDATKANCGDGVVEGVEECDLGANNGAGQGCNDDCTWTCVTTDPKRNCDDKNPCNGTETCTANHTCMPGTPEANGTMCGNGQVCSNGNCGAGSCGDGIVEAGEECDDGNSTNGDGCDSDCKFSCVSTDPTRDCASTNACVGMGTCNDTTHVCTAGMPAKDGTSCGSNLVCVGGVCGPTTCGDGIVEAGEQCDFGMGNNLAGSGCEPNCQFSCTTSPNSCDDKNPCNGQETCNSVTAANGDKGQKCAAGTPEANGTACGTGLTCQNGVCTSPQCGDGKIESPEQCDFGTSNGKGLGCSASCQFDCATLGASCAPNACSTSTCAKTTFMTQTGQACTAPTDTAKCSMCTNGLCDGAGNCKASTCGDGCIDASRGETCDPPNGTTCDANCHLAAVCGNGTIEGTEQCDDGNKLDLDGCDSKCNYEAVARMTTVSIQGGTAPAALACAHPANYLGSKALTSTAISSLNSTLSTDVNAGTTNVMTQFLGLTDLTGVAASGFSIGVLSATYDPAKGTYPGNNPEDWWFLAAASTVSNGLPTGLLGNANLAARNLTAGPSNVSLTLNLGGSPALLEMLNAKIAATINGTPAPNVPAPPPAKLASGLTVFQTITGNGSGQGLCGDITVESLAQIPIPQSLAQGGSNACGNCTGSHTYTYCGAGMPVSASCNSLLDALVGGCKVVACIVTAINATQPDVPASGTVKALSLGTNNKVPTTQSSGDKDAYSSFMQFNANRVHFTGETCTANTDCQTGQTCTSGVCK